MKSCPTLATPWTVACQTPLSMGFSRQEHWSGLQSNPGLLHCRQRLYQLSYEGSPSWSISCSKQSVVIGGLKIVLYVLNCFGIDFISCAHSQSFFSENGSWLGINFLGYGDFFPCSPLWGQCSSSEGRLKFMVTNTEISLPTGNLSHDLRIIQREQQISTRFYHYPFNQCSLPLCYEKKKLHIFGDRERGLQRVAKSHLQCKAHYCNQLSRKHPIQYLILFVVVVFFLWAK